METIDTEELQNGFSTIQGPYSYCGGFVGAQYAPPNIHKRQALVFKPPVSVPPQLSIPSVFLGGSIEMGRAEDWQTKVETECEDLPIAFLNPRRDHWDPTWEQKKDSPQFRAQVLWEHAGMNQSSEIVFYFAPNTQSPITLLELGMMADSGKVIVCCPEGYWRKGNVDIICEKFGIPQVENLEELIGHIRGRFG